MHLGQPGQLGTIVKSVKGRDTVNDRLNELERIVKQLTVARSANYTTVSPDGTLTVDGALVVTGNTVIGGTLSLPNGIIDNAALAHPFASDWIYAQSSSLFTVPVITGLPPVVLTGTASNPWPLGYDSCTVLVTVDAGATNGTASAEPLYVQAAINGAWNTATGSTVAPSYLLTQSSTVAYSVPSAPGSFVSCEASLFAAVSGFIDGSAVISALLLYYNS